MGQGITMQWDKQQIQVDAYGDGIIRICELKNGKQPYSAAVELTVEQQQKVAVAQYQVSEQGASTVFETALLRAEVEPDGTITFYNKKNNEKLTCVSEIQEIKKNTLTEEEKAFIGMEGHESGDCLLYTSRIQVSFFFAYWHCENPHFLFNNNFLVIRISRPVSLHIP